MPRVQDTRVNKATRVADSHIVSPLLHKLADEVIRRFIAFVAVLCQGEQRSAAWLINIIIIQQLPPLLDIAIECRPIWQVGDDIDVALPRWRR